MPIWKSSELGAYRPGSPTSRRSSARSFGTTRSQSQSLPPLTLSSMVDGLQDGEGMPSPTQQPATRSGNFLQGASGLEGGMASTVHAALVPPMALYGDASPGEQAPQQPPQQVQQVQQVYMRPPSSHRRRSTGNVFGVSPPTYTVQYVGIANGELGILSQKQMLAPHRHAKAGTGGGGAPASARRQPNSHAYAPGASAQRAHGAHGSPASSPRPSTAPTHSGQRRPLSVSVSMHAPQPSRSSSHSSHAASSPSPSPTRPGSAWSSAPYPQPSLHVQASAAQLHSPVGSASASAPVPGTTLTEDADGGPPFAAPHDATSAQPPTLARTPSLSLQQPAADAKPPSLTSLVEDATGRVKVVSECFYSRALHSRTGPRDRHARHNRPTGPPAQDREPLNTGLPGRFGNRAPSAGGFPGWKLTTVGPVSVVGSRAGSARDMKGGGGAEGGGGAGGGGAARGPGRSGSGSGDVAPRTAGRAQSGRARTLGAE